MHAADDTLLRWSGHGLQRTGDSATLPLLTADSWLVQDGAVRGYDAHWARFGDWCAELGLRPEALEHFRTGVTAALPRAGRWFPRVELVAPVEGGLQLWLRPAPSPAARELRVIVAAPGDPRSQPRRKGPDLELLLALRAQAAVAGAGDVLLCDDVGRLVEGARNSLLWWEGETLCTTPAQRTLPGITRALLLAIAGARGMAVRVRSPLPDELRGRETWLTNALHGIRVVSAWGGEPAAPARYAAEWQAALEQTARPLDGA